MENIDSHKFVPEISLCVAKAQYCSAFCDAIPLGVIWLILQLSGPFDLDLGSVVHLSSSATCIPSLIKIA